MEDISFFELHYPEYEEEIQSEEEIPAPPEPPHHEHFHYDNKDWDGGSEFIDPEE